MTTKTTRESTGGPKVEVLSFGLSKAMMPMSNMMDPFDGKYGAGDIDIIRPPYNLDQLAMLPEYSDILGQCIRAYKANVHGFGWELKRAAHIKPDQELPPDAVNERRRLQALFDSINGVNQNLTLLCGEKRHDLETTGMGFIEVVRNAKGEIVELYQLPAHTMRMTALDKDATEYQQPYRNEDGQYEMRPRARRFRRYVQIVNSRRRYFKEFSDPRMISSVYGKIVGKAEVPAHEVIVFRLPCAHSPYGVPRWIGSLPGIIGSRKADEINLGAFDGKMIPPLVVLVSGGTMAKTSVDRLKEIFDHELKGSQNFHKALLLEAIGSDIGEMPGEKQGTVRIDIKPLTQYIKDDGLFLNYQDKKARRLASNFLLPPIYIGLSDDYNRATAIEAARVTEEQVFIPERRDFCYLINATIMADMKINCWSLGLVAPKTTDMATILTAIAGVKEAMPVGLLQEIVAEMRGKAAAEIDEKLRDLPLGLLMAGATYDVSNVDEAAKTIKKYLDVRQEIVKRLQVEDGDDQG